jgi:hypothetical protein
MSDQDESAAPDEEPRGGLDGLRPDDEIYQGFAPGPMVWGRGADGLPSPRVPLHLPIAPPLDPATMVCLADTTEWVIRDPRWGNVVASFDERVVKRAESGERYVDLVDALGAGVPMLLVHRLVDYRTLRVGCEPKRPQCRHLAQQMTDFQDNTDAQMVMRMCTARRDDESFFMSLRDTQVHACELRTPRDPESERRIELFNATKIELGRQRRAESGETFDVDQALERERLRADAGVEHGSIFSDERK